MTKRLFTWDFFTGVLLGMLLVIVLLYFLYAKNMDSLIQDQERVREKEAVVDSMLDYISEAEMMTDWNEQAVITEPESK